MSTWHLVLLAGLGLVAAGGRAEALCVLCTCTTTATDTAFGAYSPLSGLATDTTSNVQVSCAALVGISISYAISLSQGGAASYAPRRMTSGANTLNYNLYTNAGRTTVWGDGTGGTSTVSDSYITLLSTTVRNYTVYGRIPASQNAHVGSYTDSIVATVTY